MRRTNRTVSIICLSSTEINRMRKYYKLAVPLIWKTANLFFRYSDCLYWWCLDMLRLSLFCTGNRIGCLGKCFAVFSRWPHGSDFWSAHKAWNGSGYQSCKWWFFFAFHMCAFRETFPCRKISGSLVIVVWFAKAKTGIAPIAQVVWWSIFPVDRYEGFSETETYWINRISACIPIRRCYSIMRQF